MSLKEKIYTSFGDFTFDITGNEISTEIFSVLWEVSTHFAVLNSSVYSATSICECSRRVRKNLTQAFDTFPILQQLMTDVWIVTEWPGTVSLQSNRLLVFGNTKNDAYRDFFLPSDNLLWQRASYWDDLMLFVDDQLLFYCCTHERFGSIFGDKEMFFGLKLSPTVFCTQKQWAIKGYSINDKLSKILLVK